MLCDISFTIESEMWGWNNKKRYIAIQFFFNPNFEIQESLMVFHFQAVKPDPILGVIVGSIHIADASIQENFANFLSNLERYNCIYTNIHEYEYHTRTYFVTWWLCDA